MNKRINVTEQTKKKRIYEIKKNMIEKNLHVNIYVSVCGCVCVFKRRNSFRMMKKKMPSNGIQTYFHNSIRWPSFWAFLLENNVMIQQYYHNTRKKDDDEDDDDGDSHIL